MFDAPTKGILLIVLYVLLGIFVFLLVGFTTVFLMQRKALKKQYKLMKRFNYFSDNPIASNLKPMEFLVENNEKLKPLLDYYSNLNKTYKEQMAEIKQQLMKLATYNKKMHLVKIWKFLKEIEGNLDILKEEEESFKALNLDTYSYTDNTSDISIILSSAVSKLKAFLRDSNVEKQFFKSNDSLMNTLKMVDKFTEEINKCSMTINVMDTHKAFLDVLIKIQELYDLTINYYYIHRYQLLVKSMSLSLKDIIETNQKDIVSKSIHEEINEMVKYMTEMTDKSNKALYNKQLDISKKCLSDLIENIDKCIRDISIEIKYQKLLDTTFNNFKEAVKTFVNKFNEADLFKTYKLIAQDFTEYKDENTLLNQCEKDATEVLTDIDDFKKQLAAKKIQLKPTIERINEIYKKIIHFNEENERLHDLLVNKLDIYFDNVMAVDEMIMQLHFLTNYMKDNNIKNKEIQTDINSCMSTLISLQQKFIKSKFVDTNTINNINNIESMINNIQIELNGYLITKELANRLLMYSNRDIGNDPLALSKASGYINEGKYKEGIDELIAMHTRLKKNNKKNK